MLQITNFLIYVLLFSSFICKANSQLFDDLTALTSDNMAGRQTGSSGAANARKYIQQRFGAMGYQVTEQTFNYKPGFVTIMQGVNVIAKQSKQCADCPQIFITAHYDHLGLRGNQIYPGANDNASGVASLLYLAKHLSNHTLPYQFVFVATDAEENGLYGSKYLVKQLQHQEVILNINLDMLNVSKHRPTLYALTDKVAFEQYQDRLLALSTQHLKVRVTRSSRQMNHYLDTRVDWRRASDHYAFALADISYIYFGMGEDKYHHTADDNLENMNLEGHLMATQLIEQFILQL